MSNQVIVDLFAEDRAHESFLEPLLTRIAREQNPDVETKLDNPTLLRIVPALI